MGLEMYLGMSEEEANSTGQRGTDEGSKLAGNSDLWWGGMDGVLENNSEFGTSGFDALPAGVRDDAAYGAFYGMGGGSVFLSSSAHNSNYAWGRYLDFASSCVYRYSNNYKRYGFSIRCLGD